MGSPVARLLHLNFKKAQDCDYFLLKNEKDCRELEKGALQRSVVRVDDKHLIIISLFNSEEDAEMIFQRFREWTNSFITDDDIESITIIGDLEYNAVYS